MDLAIYSFYHKRFGGLRPTGYSKTIKSMIKKNPGSLLEINLAGNLPIHIHTAGLGMKECTGATSTTQTCGSNIPGDPDPVL
jgi:hypothetical protein